MPITARNIVVKSQTPPPEEEHAVFNGITARNIFIKNQPLPEEENIDVIVVEEEIVELKPESKIVQMEEGTVIHNGQPKKFNKKMSAYMIDMLTSEE